MASEVAEGNGFTSVLPSAEVMALFGEEEKWQIPYDYMTPRAARIEEEHMRSQRHREALLLLDDSSKSLKQKSPQTPTSVLPPELADENALTGEIFQLEILSEAWKAAPVVEDKETFIAAAIEAKEAAICRLRFRQRMLKRSITLPWSPASSH